MCFEFPTTKNQTKCKAFIIGLTMASDIGVEEIMPQTNSQLEVSQVKGDVQAKEPLLQK